MPCRIGITSRPPEERMNYWNGQVHGLTNWKILARGLTKRKAQDKETELSKKYNCVASPGGREPVYASKNWLVYYFEYTRKK